MKNKKLLFVLTVIVTLLGIVTIETQLTGLFNTGCFCTSDTDDPATYLACMRKCGLFNCEYIVTTNPWLCDCVFGNCRCDIEVHCTDGTWYKGYVENECFHDCTISI